MDTITSLKPRTAHRVLVVGVGSIGERHLRILLQSPHTSVGFVEPKEALRADVASRYPAARVFESIDAAVASGVTAAVVATPAHLHVKIARRLLELGAHVLVEKPLSTTLEGVEELQKVAEESGRVAAVAYVYRAHPALAAMRKEIANGAIGTVVEVVAVAGQHFPFYRPAYRETYYASRELGGGAVQDALTHLINAGEWLAGPIHRLTADSAHQVLDGVEVEDTVHVLARQGRALACYILNQHQAANEITISVIGDRGMARFEYYQCRWRLVCKAGGPWQDFVFGPLERDQLFHAQASAFLGAIDGVAEPLCTLDAAVDSLKVNLAILQSAASGNWEVVSKVDHAERSCQK